jgi:hypothetical protein
MRVRVLDAVTSLRSAIFLAAFVLILGALAVRQAFTQKLHAEEPPAAGGVAGSNPSLETGEGAIIESQDPARDLIESIVDRKFENRAQVVMERLRPDFERVAADLEELDLSQVRAMRRGQDWVILTAPLRRRDQDPAGEREPSKEVSPPAVYQLRLVRQENVWKLDRMKKLEGDDS